MILLVPTGVFFEYLSKPSVVTTTEAQMATSEVAILEHDTDWVQLLKNYLAHRTMPKDTHEKDKLI